MHCMAVQSNGTAHEGLWPGREGHIPQTEWGQRVLSAMNDLRCTCTATVDSCRTCETVRSTDQGVKCVRAWNSAESPSRTGETHAHERVGTKVNEMSRIWGTRQEGDKDTGIKMAISGLGSHGTTGPLSKAALLLLFSINHQSVACQPPKTRSQYNNGNVHL